MVKDRSVAVLSTVLCLAACAWAQVSPWEQSVAPLAAGGSARSSTDLVSVPVAERFGQIAHEIARSGNAGGSQVDQAIILLIAAQRLNPHAEDTEPLLLELAMRQVERDYSQQVFLWLQSYVAEGADHAIIADAIQYLLTRQKSPEGQRQVLEELVGRIGNRNAAIDSELATSLGLLTQSGGDAKAARFYFLQAYESNPYNPMAFAKLAEVVPNDIGPAAYLEHLRLLVRENPLDLDPATNLARYAERLELYEMAAGTYRYSAELFQYLYPAQPLPPDIYLPWAIACYNSKRQQRLCLQIAERVRSRGRFDILLEAIAGRAAARAGNAQEAQRIFSQTEQQAQQFLQAGPGQALMGRQGAVTSVRELSPKQFAWFYCFADPNAEKALDWANKGYSVEPNSPATGALLAYALSMNGQLEWAKPLLASFGHNQIAELVQAQVQLSQGDKAGAIAMLKAAVARDPGSLAAERAKEMLREQGDAHVTPVDASALMTLMPQGLRQTLVPEFASPDQRIGLQFSLRGVEFAYGSEIEGVVAIANKGLEPLVVTDSGLITGRIRVDARVRGDLTREIPNLVSQTIRTSLTVPSGRSLSATLRLNTGQLRRMLLDYPQASLDVEFTLYVDPVVTADGSVANRLIDVKPAVVSIRRPGMQLGGQYVRNRFKAIASGQQAQKLRTAQLFTGLLKEQQAMAQHGTLYAYRSSAWLPGLLRSSLLDESGLLLNSGDGDWVVRVHTMADMLSLSIDRELATAVAKNLNHPQWPVRLMAVYLLATSPRGDFGKVLDWVAQNDANELVRSLAMSLRSVGSKRALASPGR